MRPVSELIFTRVWVDPGHLAISALYVLKGHGAKAVAVLEEDKLVGIVTEDRLEGASERLLVREAMLPVKRVVDSSMPVRKAAELFVHENLDYAPVVQDDQFIGILTSNMLLRELGRSWDPLTGLSWSDSLREWGVEQLKRNKEITILFFDLDDFGNYNKVYGHIIGDRVLRRFAAVIKESIEASLDVFARFGGDEFVIGTLRPRPEAENLTSIIRERCKNLVAEEVMGNLSFSVGISGGKRTKERENVHFASTLDELINLASKACQEEKKRKDSSKPSHAPSAVILGQIAYPSMPQEDQHKPALTLVNVDESQGGVPTTVSLSYAGQVHTGVDMPGTAPLSQSVAAATARALERALPSVQLVIDEVVLNENETGEKYVTVIGKVQEGSNQTLIAATELVQSDLFRTVAQVTLAAFFTRGGTPPHPFDLAESIQPHSSQTTTPYGGLTYGS